MSESRPGLPLPVPTPITEGFWQAAAEGRLVIQRCDDCGRHRHSPTAACYGCQSQAWSWDEVSGRGTVFSYTWSHHPVHPGIADLGVYNVSVVELDDTVGDPVRLVTWVDGALPGELEIGTPVRVAFDPVSENVALPIFRRA